MNKNRLYHSDNPNTLKLLADDCLQNDKHDAAQNDYACADVCPHLKFGFLSGTCVFAVVRFGLVVVASCSRHCFHTVGVAGLLHNDKNDKSCGDQSNSGKDNSYDKYDTCCSRCSGENIEHVYSLLADLKGINRPLKLICLCSIAQCLCFCNFFWTKIN